MRWPDIPQESRQRTSAEYVSKENRRNLFAISFDKLVLYWGPMLCPNQQRSFLAGNWTKGMIAVHLLTPTGTRIEPQLSQNMSGYTTRIAPKNECRKYLILLFKLRNFFSPYFLIRLLRI